VDVISELCKVPPTQHVEPQRGEATASSAELHFFHDGRTVGYLPALNPLKHDLESNSMRKCSGFEQW
jgi:hypothetical protein